jgi:hypothetical protein
VARSKVSSFVAAGLLSALTLGTFYVLRNYGPESAIWIFHDAVFKKDIPRIASVTLQPPDNANVGRLVAAVAQLKQAGARVEIMNVQRGPHEVIVWIAYVLPEGERDIYWVIDQSKSSSWLINADKTVQQQPTS